VNVVVVGSGAREHALAVAIAATADVTVTPGNAGIPKSVAASPLALEADLFVIGPEAPLVDGLADRLRAQGKRVFGPGRDGAQLEGSKAWMKDVVAEAGVPTARYATFSEAEPAVAFLKTLPAPYVVKTDGLAAGKGVLVTDSLADAEADVRAKLAGETFGGAGRTVVIEEGMTGPELSVLAICDGNDALLLPAAQDFKREFDNDEGPNTGGMGAYSPVPGVDVDALDIKGRFIEPTLNALRKRDIDYRGVLYAGLMLTPEGPKLVEFNVRFGDPEAECVLPRVTGDLTEVLARAADGRVPARIAVGADAAVTVMASGKAVGAPISGIDEADAIDGVSVVHARTARDRGQLVTAGGGRILGVTGMAPTLREARERAYAGMSRIAFEGMHYRTDIARAAAEESK
jgi:phosphoribosylamine---glycine ligase